LTTTRCRYIVQLVLLDCLDRPVGDRIRGSRLVRERSMFIAEKRARISDNIAEQILRYAEENQIQVGEQLPSERQLARYFGVGRTSVREGLRRLEILGQVEIIPSKGVYLKEGAIGTIDKVLKLWLKRNERAIRELVELRVALETKTAHMAA